MDGKQQHEGGLNHKGRGCAGIGMVLVGEFFGHGRTPLLHAERIDMNVLIVDAGILERHLDARHHRWRSGDVGIARGECEVRCAQRIDQTPGHRSNADGKSISIEAVVCSEHDAQFRVCRIPGFERIERVEIALYHALGTLPVPETAHEFFS